MEDLFEPRLIGFLVLLFVIFQVFVLIKVLRMTDDVNEIKKYLKALLDQKKNNESK